MFMSDIGLYFLMELSDFIIISFLLSYYHIWLFSMFWEKVSPLLFSGKVYVDLTLFLR